MNPETLLSERLKVAPGDLAAFAGDWNIAKLEVFGSLLRQDSTLQATSTSWSASRRARVQPI